MKEVERNTFRVSSGAMCWNFRAYINKGTVVCIEINVDLPSTVQT